jgi:CRISPR-associated protein Cas2
MWLIVSFDLPVVTKSEKRLASNFRKALLQDGFAMMQYSVYIRHCASSESVEVHIKRVKRIIPSKGHVSIMQITDKQYGGILNFWGKKTTPMKKAPAQIELF